MRRRSLDGYIGANYDGGLFIPYTATIQPDYTWIDKTIVLNSTGPNTYLDEPLIVGSIVSATVLIGMSSVNGTKIFLSKDGAQLDFSIYGPSVSIAYGLATSVKAQTTILVRSNFGVFKNGEELNGPNAVSPQFRQVSDTQFVEIYNIDDTTGQYIENVSNADTITIKTYGLLAQRVRTQLYQYGSLIRSTPITVNIQVGNQVSTENIAVNSGGPAFITDLPPPVDPKQVTATKILLPRVMI
jgi:hypothetical protein